MFAAYIKMHYNSKDPFHRVCMYHISYMIAEYIKSQYHFCADQYQDPRGRKYLLKYIYPKFAKLFIQIAEPKNIQHTPILILCWPIPGPKRSKVLAEIYPKFAKLFIQIAGPKNIQHTPILISLSLIRFQRIKGQQSLVARGKNLKQIWICDTN